jgi:hypothetical protein
MIPAPTAKAVKLKFRFNFTTLIIFYLPCSRQTRGANLLIHSITGNYRARMVNVWISMT